MLCKLSLDRIKRRAIARLCTCSVDSLGLTLGSAYPPIAIFDPSIVGGGIDLDQSGNAGTRPRHAPGGVTHVLRAHTR